MKIDGFDWDAGNWPKCGRHGASRDEIEALFRKGPNVYADPLHSQSEQRLRAVGQTISGRWLLVAFTYRENGDTTLIRPVSARYMHKKEVAYYERQQSSEEDAGSADG
ncbi:BrnT family toxin [Jiella sp. M17.18]|uniref:BrnT family toxin n=1 Tax=Jiella sp. M17.18 TaxID=3234247 RepID=UPI0034DEA5A7